MERFRALYREGRTDQNGLRVDMPRPSKIHESESSEGIVRKFTLPLGPARTGVYDKGAAGATLETESVIIPMIGKRGVRTHTLCVSSQVGCAMGCGFCQTAQMGLVRNLTAEEIVAQWYAARWMVPGYSDEEVSMWRGEEVRSSGASPATSLPLHLRLPQSRTPGCSTIRNMVFMGMGEPMDNLEAVIAAIAVLTDRNGANLPMSKVTISTVGRVDGIERLAKQVHEPGWHRLGLAISLNASNDEVREAIMPINRRYSLSDLRGALEAWPLYGGSKLCMEYVLIPGVNDAPEHAVELGDFVFGRGEYAGRPALQGLVNLIPYNPRDGSPWPAPEEERVNTFLGWLTDTGVYAKRRRTKGRDTMSACGQLGNLEHRRKRVAVTVSAASSGADAK
jgi:23S rRNA (adenine2503-C2)-methyltransferase